MLRPEYVAFDYQTYALGIEGRGSKADNSESNHPKQGRRKERTGVRLKRDRAIDILFALSADYQHLEEPTAVPRYLGKLCLYSWADHAL